MTTDLNDVLMELDSKIAEVYDLDLAEEMSDIYIDLSDRLDEFSSQYWKLVKALATVEKDRDQILKKYTETVTKHNGTLKQYNETSGKYIGTLKDVAKMIDEERKLRKKTEKEKDQAEYDMNYYRNEVEWLRNEVEWHRKEAEKERRLRITAEYEKELAEMELLGQEGFVMI